MFEGPIIEVHVSNIHARDELHRHSKLSSAVKGVAMQAAAHFLGKLPDTVPTSVRDGPR